MFGIYIESASSTQPAGLAYGKQFIIYIYMGGGGGSFLTCRCLIRLHRGRDERGEEGSEWEWAYVRER